MIGYYNRSVIVTYVGICMSVAGIGLAMSGNLHPAFVCLIWAGICDLFDGVIARRCKRTKEEKQFGVQIDSLADMISFIAFPVVLLIGQSPLSIWTGSVAVIYVLAGIIRLGWFHVHTAEADGMRFYEGLPVTYVALILPTVYMAALLLQRHLDLNCWDYRSIVYVVVAFLFLMRVKVKKPGGKWYLVFSLLAVAETIFFICM